MKYTWTMLLVLSGTMLEAQDLASAAGGATAAEKTYEEAEKAYQRADYSDAIALYGQVLAMDPDDLNAYLHRGFCHSLNKEYEEAVNDFTAVIQRKPDHIWAYTSRGSAYNKLERYDKAIQDFDTVLSLDPRNEEAYNNRGWTKKGMGDAKGACKDWKASQRMGNAEAKIILNNNRCK
ncbi:MAG: tetratricopeptide repeat protein [Flavobacteriales bacterium]|nr:tetratricopeptide repeat protein [Flavobacteriales bacterium]MCB9167893.1 tetratricopeptide repeat protein [Flavobacteriales bacterium]